MLFSLSPFSVSATTAYASSFSTLQVAATNRDSFSSIFYSLSAAEVDSKAVTRGQFAALLISSRGDSTLGASGNLQEHSPSWFESELSRAVESGLISTYPDGSMMPDKPITRQEAACMIARAIKSDKNGTVKYITRFQDFDRISEWSRTSVEVCVEANYLIGHEDNTFRPNNLISWPEARIIIDRLTGKPFAFSDINITHRPGSNPTEQGTADYLESIRNNEELLHRFVVDMPKGADLHNHLTGGIYAEDYLNWAAQDGYFIDSNTGYIYSNKSSDTPLIAVKDAVANPLLYNRMIDALSMRNFVANTESGHDHFFNTFSKFKAVSNTHFADMLSRQRDSASSQNIDCLELMISFPSDNLKEITNSIEWDLSAMPEIYSRLTSSPEFKISLDNAIKILKNEEKLGGVNQVPSGDDVTIRYIIALNRTQSSPKDLFVNASFVFHLAKLYPDRIVGINMVAPEDNPISLKDYDTHMSILSFLVKQVPGVNISLHAGELTSDLVDPSELRSHIRKAVEIGQASRIGHGVSIVNESDYQGLLMEMAQEEIPVEILLTSNEQILNVEPENHPILLYLANDVPVVLATDDQGVSRSDLSKELIKAVQVYDLGYGDLKWLIRNSLEYSFLPGESIWCDSSYGKMIDECSSGIPGNKELSSTCQEFLNQNTRAKLQWDLEADFNSFEAQITKSSTSPN